MQHDNHTTSSNNVLRTNRLVADRLLEAAQILSKKRANQFRVRAYRSAANSLDNLNIDLVDIIEREGVNGLIKLPYIGKSIAYTIYELVLTGRWKLLERLRESLQPPKVFELVPGIGPILAEKIHSILKIKSLEELESAAYAGKLTEIHGINERRQSMIRETLTSMLSDTRRIYHLEKNGPDISTLLKIDEIYRKKVKEGSLKTISPRRFNPSGKAWLPVFHYQDKHWQFTVMFSNSERAHRLHRQNDWVIIIASDNTHHEFHRTIVTETSGSLKGKRVVRGYESECMKHYSSN